MMIDGMIMMMIINRMLMMVINGMRITMVFIQSPYSYQVRCNTIYDCDYPHVIYLYKHLSYDTLAAIYSDRGVVDRSLATLLIVKLSNLIFVVEIIFYQTVNFEMFLKK
jgi:hypothetical protein